MTWYIGEYENRLSALWSRGPTREGFANAEKPAVLPPHQHGEFRHGETITVLHHKETIQPSSTIAAITPTIDRQIPIAI